METTMATLMRHVYGDWSSSEFPKPLSKEEAGPSPNTGQRRYLWTDAFGVLNFVAMGQPEAAERLVRAVHETLGNPRSDEFPMMKKNGKYVGLRIGKTNARKQSDLGMDFDGMYWHYLDKWFYAVARLSLLTEDPELLQETIDRALTVFPAFARYNRNGRLEHIRWKLNVDTSPIGSDTPRGPSSDSVGAFIAFAVLRDAALKLQLPKYDALDTVVQDCRSLANAYLHQLPVTGDPLGWGLSLWESQWLQANAADLWRSRLLPYHRDVLLQDSYNLHFRLYGAALGAILTGTPEVRDLATTAILDHDLPLTLASIAHPDKKRFSLPGLDAIDTVMLAACLDPSPFHRQDHETSLLSTLAP